MRENEPLKVGDKISTSYNFETTVEDVYFCKHARLNLVWFYNERGEYKYNTKEFLTKINK